MSLHSINPFGQGLNRPECVLTHSSGLVFVPSWQDSGGISIINQAGQCTNLFCTSSQKSLKPNGIALEANGHFLLTHLGDNDGGVFRLNAGGELSSVVTHANGDPLPPTNFVTKDAFGRIWITVSTRKFPRSKDYRSDAASGFIAVAEPGESNARIVADELGYTNECVIDLERSAVYVNETFARQLSKFDLSADGSLTNKSTVTEFGAGTYPDGITVDERGHFWITSIVSNRVIRVSPTGEQTLMVEDLDEPFVQAAELAYNEHRLDKPHLASTGDTTLPNLSSMAFGGIDGRTVYLGNLLGSCLHTFDASVKGKEPLHWNLPLGPLADLV